MYSRPCWPAIMARLQLLCPWEVSLHALPWECPSPGRCKTQIHFEKLLKKTCSCSCSSLIWELCNRVSRNYNKMPERVHLEGGKVDLHSQFPHCRLALMLWVCAGAAPSWWEHMAEKTLTLRKPETKEKASVEPTVLISLSRACLQWSNFLPPYHITLPEVFSTLW